MIATIISNNCGVNVYLLHLRFQRCQTSYTMLRCLEVEIPTLQCDDTVILRSPVRCQTCGSKQYGTNMRWMMGLQWCPDVPSAICNHLISSDRLQMIHSLRVHFALVFLVVDLSACSSSAFSNRNHRSNRRYCLTFLQGHDEAAGVPARGFSQNSLLHLSVSRRLFRLSITPCRCDALSLQWDISVTAKAPSDQEAEDDRLSSRTIPGTCTFMIHDS